MEETEERRRSTGSKTSKKGGKRTKALTAEEEARRREELKETLREKLELEKRALKVVERLLEDSVAEDFLIDCAKLMTPANYKDTVEERSIAKLCGYPICPNKLGKIPTQKYKISTKTNKVYDITERKCYCCNSCYKASKEFELQISTTPLWLRQHESPPQITLMKKGDSGSSGQEVMLSERRLQEEDIEDPLAAQHEDPPGAQPRSAAADLSHSESSDIEQEQDFVSSVVSQKQGPRVHWGDLPKRTDEDKRGEKERKAERRNPQRSDDEERAGGGREDENKLSCRVHADKTNGEQLSEPEDGGVEEVTSELNLCSLSESVPHTDPLLVNSTVTQADQHISPPCEDLKHLPSSAPIGTTQDSCNASLTGLNITQVGMSRRGAAGLRDLLRNQTAVATTFSIRMKLLESLRRTLMAWRTEASLKFLYGSEQSLDAPLTDVRGEKEEELDEDDLDDEVVHENAGDDGAPKTPSAAAPNYETLRQETQQLELRVKEFYKGTLVLPGEVEELPGRKVTVQDPSTKDPVLPLVDSQAQHLIQKRITVEKLTSCLGNIIGPLHLTVSDVSTDLNNLVRTFRFTNKNIIHKTPEWTLIAVVLLHLLSEVSPVVHEALEMPASVEYLNTLMEELGLQEQDLLDLVRVFKALAH